MGEAFVPTHAVPDDGLPAWSTPVATAAPVATLEPHLRVRALQRRDDGWARFLCSNGWSAWTDGRRLRDLRSLWLVPVGGLPAWNDPNPALPSRAALNPGLEVQLLALRDDGWAAVLCSNGWSAWVDGRRLTPVLGADAPTADLAGGWDQELREAWSRHRALVQDLQAGRIDNDAFSRRGVQAGTVIRGAEVLLLDSVTAGWWRYDGMRLAPRSGGAASDPG
ncbi:MAG TPA: hypothetical protein VG869_16795 [Acidimicrobiia bacterium]|jgi:hypothetical protein|nr:hypothetical protein [Acidimicrobiia bacterium]